MSPSLLSLPVELQLQILEAFDIHTLSNMQLTHPHFSNVVKHYETSISKRILYKQLFHAKWDFPFASEFTFCNISNLTANYDTMDSIMCIVFELPFPMFRATRIPIRMYSRLIYTGLILLYQLQERTDDEKVTFLQSSKRDPILAMKFAIWVCQIGLYERCLHRMEFPKDLVSCMIWFMGGTNEIHSWEPTFSFFQGLERASVEASYRYGPNYMLSALQDDPFPHPTLLAVLDEQALTHFNVPSLFKMQSPMTRLDNPLDLRGTAEAQLQRTTPVWATCPNSVIPQNVFHGEFSYGNITLEEQKILLRGGNILVDD